MWVRAEENGSQEIGKPQVVRLATAPDRNPADIATTTFEEEKAMTTFVDEVDLNVEEMEEVIAPALTQNHNQKGMTRRFEPGEIKALHYRALAIFERAYGPEHYEIAVNLNNLGALKHAQGKSEEAEQLYRRALAIKEKLLGADHPDVAMTLNNLAALVKKQGEYEMAETMYKRALAIFERALGADHPKVVACRENYASLLRKINR
jgi:tetratricopeptide (TPR) repeat protein